MKNYKKIIASLLIALLVLGGINTVSAATKVFFYESKMSGNYKIGVDYSQLRDRLRENGYEVSDIRVGLTREALATVKADILVITSLSTDLTATELAAIYQYTMEDGKGVLVIGATAAANKLTTPMGMLVVEDPLEDEMSQIVDKSTGKALTDKTFFYVNTPRSSEDVAVNTMVKGVYTLCVFGGNGIYVFGKAKPIILAGDNANSPKMLTFPRGSNPPISAYAKLGRGMVVFVNDPDMFTNKNLDQSKYKNDNLRFAANIVDWLAQQSVGEEVPESEMDLIIRSLMVETGNMNRTIISLEKDKSSCSSQLSSCTTDKATLSDELAALQQSKFMGLDYIVWAILLLAAGFFLTAGFLYKTKMIKPRKKKVTPEEAGDLSYEFGGKTGGEFTDEQLLAGEVKEEDIEARLKELEKKGGGGNIGGGEGNPPAPPQPPQQ